ncbi:MAG: PorV/PorQ family protein [Elusimicrobiota bacterium]
MKRIIKISVVVAVCLFISNAWAGFSGKTGMHFLKIAVGPRGIAMGEAQTAVSDDINGLYWNPAGLGRITDIEAHCMYNKWFQEIASQYVAGAVPIRKTTEDGIQKNYGTVALAVNYLSVEPFQGYDAGGVPTSMVDSADMAVSAAYGRRLYRKIYGGITLKYLSERLDTVTATAFGADLGLLYPLDNGVSFGLAVQNLGTSMTFIDEAGSLPRTIKLGTGYTKDFFGQKFTAALDANMPNDNDMYFGGGVEYWIKDMIAVRTGYRTGIDIGSGLRAGLGIKASAFQLDYAFADYGDLGDTHRIGLSMRFGQGVKQDRVDVMYNRGEVYYNEARYSEAIIEFNKLLEIAPTHKKTLEMLKKSHEKLNQSIKEIKEQTKDQEIPKKTEKI